LDTQESEGRAEEMIKEFLGRKLTQLFLHELRAWLRSPCITLNEWDRAVQYDGGDLSRRGNNDLVDPDALAAASGLATQAEGSAIILKYHEPHDASKPSRKDEWKLFIFKEKR
jgi:hypothetical protein